MFGRATIRLGICPHSSSLCFCTFLSFCLRGFAFALLDLVFSVFCQEIGWEERLGNDLVCVEWGRKTLTWSVRATGWPAVSGFPAILRRVLCILNAARGVAVDVRTLSYLCLANC